MISQGGRHEEKKRRLLAVFAAQLAGGAGVLRGALWVLAVLRPYRQHGVPGVCGAEELFRHPDKLPVPERGLQQRRVHGDLRPPGHGFGPGAVPVPAEDETGPGCRHHGASAAPGSPLGDHRLLLESAL